jgi:nucleoside-diphosphate-sugar epimerase
MNIANAPKVVMVTGAAGNLGAKAIEILSRADWCEKIVGLYSPNREPIVPEHARDKLVAVAADLTDPCGAWEAAMPGVEGILHFAAKNPVPEAGWEDSVASFDMTVNLGLSALRHGVRRFVFCSSNHVMGKYKDEPLASEIGPGRLTEDLPFAPGTVWDDQDRHIDATAYAASKVMGERFATAIAAGSAGKLTSVSMRVGWALPDDNNPANVSISGTPNEMESAKVASDPETARTLRWFRDMWLSNGDFERLIVASLTADASNWGISGVVVNGTSANGGGVWGIANGERLIGYRPEDDLFLTVKA